MDLLLEKYIKKNNIRRYLSLEYDLEGLTKELQECFSDFLNDFDDDYTIEDFIYKLIAHYNYLMAKENEDISELLYYIGDCEFDIEINQDGTINLIDLQGAYLGGCDTYENFDTIVSAAERLEGSFLYDYFGIETY